MIDGRVRAINDVSCRENLYLLGDTGIAGVRVARELDTLVRLYGKPARMVSHNGNEFTSLPLRQPAQSAPSV